jgi:hypothetical protein
MDLSRHSGTLIQRIGRMVTYPVSYGAVNSLYAGTAPAAGELNGKVSISLSKLAHGASTYTHCFIVSHPLGTGHTPK